MIRYEQLNNRMLSVGQAHFTARTENIVPAGAETRKN